jgi:hypothetical protein
MEGATRDPRRTRRIVAGILVVVASLGVMLSTVGAWARRTVTDTDRYVSIVGPLIEDPVIQQALATRITDAVFEVIDLEAVVADALPEQAQFLTAPITNAVRGFVRDRTADLLDTEAAARLWVTVNGLAHEEIMAVLREETTFVSVSDGEARLNLLPLIDAAIAAAEEQASGLLGRDIALPTAEELSSMAPDEVRARIEEALGITLPEDFGSIVVLRSRALGTAQSALALAERAIVLLVLVTLVLIVAAVLVSVNRRRTIAQLGLGAFLGLLLVRRAALRLDDDIVALIPARSVAAARKVVDAFMENLRGFTTPLFVISALVAIGAFAWGRRTWIAEQANRLSAIAPGQARPGWASWTVEHADAVRIGGVAVAMVLLFLLNFTFLNVLLVGVLVVAGELGLRWLERAAEAQPS